MAAAANSIISSPTLPTLPTAWSLIEYAIGYKEMQQLSKMEGYSQSFGQAKFWLWKQPILHGNDNIDIMIFSPYLIDFIGFKSYHELHLYTTTNKLNWYWRSYGSAKFCSETHHRSLDFRRAVTLLISNFWHYFLHRNADNDIFYRLYNCSYRRQKGGLSA